MSKRKQKLKKKWSLHYRKADARVERAHDLVSATARDKKKGASERRHAAVLEWEKASVCVCAIDRRGDKLFPITFNHL